MDDRRAVRFEANVPGSATTTRRPTTRAVMACALASDDLFDCRWTATHEYRAIRECPIRILCRPVARSLDGEERLITNRLHCQEAPRGPGHDRVPLLDQQLAGLLRRRRFAKAERGSRSRSATTASPTAPGDPPAFCFYRPHRAGQGTYHIGFEMPWPIVGPYTLMGPDEWDYSHLCRQDRFTQVWLETQGYQYDVLTDTDLHLDSHVLDGYSVLFVVGHSEYWSFEAMEARSVDFWTAVEMQWCCRVTRRSGAVSFNADASIIECRKGDVAGDAGPADRRGEMWHSHDGRRGGHVARMRLPRMAAVRSGVLFARRRWGHSASVPTRCVIPTTFCFDRPNDLKLSHGDSHRRQAGAA